MNGLIGGSGSTGSSVLRQMLNRHPDFYCINESSVFCKKSIYANWKRNKYNLVKRGWSGLRSAGFHIYNGIDLTDVDYGPKLKELKEWIDSSSSFKDFASCVSDHFSSLTKAKVVFEKTPGNAAIFREFSHEIKDARFIACLRNPLDSISSLVSRGFSVYYSAAVYLYNTSYVLSYDGDITFCKYEDLIDDPKLKLNELQLYLGLAPINLLEKKTAISDVSKDVTKIGSWSFDETDNIQKVSNSKFDILNSSLKKEILGAIRHLSIEQSYSKKNKLKFSTIPEITEHLDYTLPALSKQFSSNDLRVSRTKDIINRTIRVYPMNIFNYPIKVT